MDSGQAYCYSPTVKIFLQAHLEKLPIWGEKKKRRLESERGFCNKLFSLKRHCELRVLDFKNALWLNCCLPSRNTCLNTCTTLQHCCSTLSSKQYIFFILTLLKTYNLNVGFSAVSWSTKEEPCQTFPLSHSPNFPVCSKVYHSLTNSST